LNIDNRIKRIEAVVKPENPLQPEDRVKVIYVDVQQGRESEAEEYIADEKKRILKELYEKYANFDESNFSLFVVKFVSPLPRDEASSRIA